MSGPGLAALKNARVLVTRADPSAEVTGRRLRAEGAVALVAPVLRARPRPVATDVAQGAQAILVTSANGARRLADLALANTTPVLAVGDATARVARAAGFTDVVSARGDGVALAALAAERLDPDGGPVLHLHGVHTAGDILAPLRRAGFETRDATAYEATAVDALPEIAVEALTARSVDAVLFHSARGAAEFGRLVEQAHLSGACASLAAVAISRAALAPAQSMPFQVRRTAEAPNEAALFVALAAALGARS